MNRARWHCRVCRTWGTGGPDAATSHVKREHDAPDWGVGAESHVGFVPNYAADANRSTEYAIRPVTAQGGTGHPTEPRPGGPILDPGHGAMRV